MLLHSTPEPNATHCFAGGLRRSRVKREQTSFRGAGTTLDRPHRSPLFWMVALALLCTSCTGLVDRPTGTHSRDSNSPAHRLSYMGLEREYQLYVPKQTPAHEPIPLLISLHDAGTDAGSHRRQTGFDALADTSRFAVAYPQAWQRRVGRPARWNVGECCGDAGKESVDDVTFIRHVIDEVVSKKWIDQSRIYVAGIGNGAMLAHLIAQQLPTLVAAVAAVGGTPTRDDFTPAAPVPLLQMHSADDPLAPYNGGRASLPRSRETVEQAGVAKTLRRWTQANECAKYPTLGRDIFGALGTVTAGQQASFYYHAECHDQKEIAFWRLDGFGHAWPGGWDIDADDVATKRNDIIDASREIWKWLSRFRRAQD